MAENYYQTAIENEDIFRNVLRDLRDNRKERPMGAYVPEDLETEANLQDIFTKYSGGYRYGKFTIILFSRLTTDNLARIIFQDIACLSGGGADLEYVVNPDNSVVFKKAVTTWRS